MADKATGFFRINPDEIDLVYAGDPPDPAIVKHYEGTDVRFLTAAEFREYQVKYQEIKYEPRRETS